MKIRIKDSNLENYKEYFEFTAKDNNYNLIRPGVKFVFETNFGIWHFIAYGTVRSIDNNQVDSYTKYTIKYDLKVLSEVVPNFYKQRIITELKSVGERSYNTSIILSLTKETYESILNVIKSDTPTLNPKLFNTVDLATFHLWLSSKLTNVGYQRTRDNNYLIYKFYRFTYHVRYENTPIIRLINGKWIDVIEIKKLWKPDQWGCINQQNLVHKNACDIIDVCTAGTICNQNNGVIWFMDSYKLSFSKVNLEVLKEQVLHNQKIPFEYFCQYILNRTLIDKYAQDYIIKIFNFSEEELDVIFSDVQISDLPRLNTSEELIINSLKQKKQVILYGPPGTGKTFLADKIANYLVHPSGMSNQIKIQFHPSYSYQDFIEGIFPEIINNQLNYKMKDGHFKRLCNIALERPTENFCIIIDEINRGNLPKIMGELFYSLEYRGDEYAINLASSPDTDFVVPENVYIIGTMNTADRSLADIDVALRRRFRFIEVPPNYDILQMHYKSISADENRSRQMINLLKSINTILFKKKKSKDLLIGHSYFMIDNLSDDLIRDLLLFEIIPLLEDYFYNNKTIVNTILQGIEFEDGKAIDPSKFNVDQFLGNYNGY